VKAFFDANPRFASGLHRASHAAGATAADRLHEIAPFMGKSPRQIRAMQAWQAAGRLVGAVKAAPAFVARARKQILEKGPVLMSRAREEWIEVRPAAEEKVKEKLGKLVPGRRKPAPEAVSVTA